MATRCATRAQPPATYDDDDCANKTKKKERKKKTERERAVERKKYTSCVKVSSASKNSSARGSITRAAERRRRVHAAYRNLAAAAATARGFLSGALLPALPLPRRATAEKSVRRKPSRISEALFCNDPFYFPFIVSYQQSPREADSCDNRWRGGGGRAHDEGRKKMDRF